MNGRRVRHRHELGVHLRLRAAGGRGAALDHLVRFAFDLAIGYPVVRYGRTEFPCPARALHLPSPAALLVLAFLVLDHVSLRFDEGEGVHTSFGGNLAMSALFLSMLAARRSTRGRSLGIAVRKMIGTACAALFVISALHVVPLSDAASHLHPRYDSAFVYCLYTGCFLLDLASVYAVFAAGRAERAAAAGGEPAVMTALPSRSTPLNGAPELTGRRWSGGREFEGRTPSCWRSRRSTSRTSGATSPAATWRPCT
ncbi:transmembrane-type terpene cyclase [Streptomyces sp. NPDC001076]